MWWHRRDDTSAAQLRLTAADMLRVGQIIGRLEKVADDLEHAAARLTSMDASLDNEPAPPVPQAPPGGTIDAGGNTQGDGGRKPRSPRPR